MRVGLLQAEQPKVNIVLQAGAAVVDYITVNRAVEVNYSTAGRQQNINLAAGGNNKIRLAIGRVARVYYNSSIVLTQGRFRRQISTESCHRVNS